MIATEFHSPLGVWLGKWKYDHIRDLVAERCPDYWSPSLMRAPGRLVQKIGDITRELRLILAEPAGYLVEHSVVEQHCHRTACWSDEWHELVDYYVGRQKFHAPRACFLSSELTIAVLQEFYETGETSDQVRWIDRSRQWH